MAWVALLVLASSPVPGCGCQGTGGFGRLSGPVAVPGREPALSLVTAGRGQRQRPGLLRPGLLWSPCVPMYVIPSVHPVGQSISRAQPRFRGGGWSPGFSLGGGAVSEVKGVDFTRDRERGSCLQSAQRILKCFGLHVKTQTSSLSNLGAVKRGRNTLL